MNKSFLRQQIVAHPIISFFTLAALISWVIWIPLIQPLQGLMTFDVPIWAIVLLIVGATGPSLAGLLVAYCQNCRSGIRSLFKLFTIWRVGWRWYVLVLGLPVLFFWLTIAVHALLTGEQPQLDTSLGWLLLPNLVLAFAVRFLVALPTGPLAEEMGWRGFALPQLQRQTNSLNASLIIGVAWGLWHLPMFWVPGVALPGGETILTQPTAVFWYVLGTIGKSIIFT